MWRILLSLWNDGRLPSNTEVFRRIRKSWQLCIMELNSFLDIIDMWSISASRVWRQQLVEPRRKINIRQRIIQHILPIYCLYFLGQGGKHEIRQTQHTQFCPFIVFISYDRRKT